MTDVTRVGFLGGVTLQGNVRTLLSNIQRLLEESDQAFECDLLISAESEPPEGYRPVRMDIDPGSIGCAKQRLRLLHRAIEQYALVDCPDVLMQVTRFPTHGSALALAGWRTRTPTITRLAGDNFREYQFATDWPEKLRMFALKNVISLTAVHLSNAVVVLGPNGRTDIERRFRRAGIWEIPQPVNQSRFSPGEAASIRDSLDIALDERLLLTVGRVSRRKGAETIRNVAPSCDGTWVVLGDGPMRETLDAMPGIKAPGQVPHKETVDYYRAADLYIHPSLHEGLPNVLLEATACGTPCIARDTGECGTVAVKTFSDDAGLREALTRTYESVELESCFREECLSEMYTSLLKEVAK